MRRPNHSIRTKAIFPTVCAVLACVVVQTLPAQPLPHEVAGAANVLATSKDKAAKLGALAVVAATTGLDRDRTLLRFAKTEYDVELRERAILELSSTVGADIERGLTGLLESEKNPGVRYAIRHALGSIERNQGRLERGLSLRLDASGLEKLGSPGLLSLEVETEAGQGFGRLNLQLPPGLRAVNSPVEWHGLVLPKDRRRLDVQVLAEAPGVYEIQGIFWLKLQSGGTFKGDSRIRTVRIAVTVPEVRK